MILKSDFNSLPFIYSDSTLLMSSQACSIISRHFGRHWRLSAIAFYYRALMWTYNIKTFRIGNIFHFFSLETCVPHATTHVCIVLSKFRFWMLGISMVVFMPRKCRILEFRKILVMRHDSCDSAKESIHKLLFCVLRKLPKESFLKLIILSTGQSVPISAVLATISCLRCYFDKIFNNDWIKFSSSTSTWYFVLDIRIIQWLDVATCVSEITKVSRDC